MVELNLTSSFLISSLRSLAPSAFAIAIILFVLGSAIIFEIFCDPPEPLVGENLFDLAPPAVDVRAEPLPPELRISSRSFAISEAEEF